MTSNRMYTFGLFHRSPGKLKVTHGTYGHILDKVKYENDQVAVS